MTFEVLLLGRVIDGAAKAVSCAANKGVPSADSSCQAASENLFHFVIQSFCTTNVNTKYPLFSELSQLSRTGH